MNNIIWQYYDIIRILTNIPNEIIIFIYYIINRRVAIAATLVRCLFIPYVGMLKLLWMVPIDPLLKNSRSAFSFPSTHTVSISIPYFGLAISLKRFGVVLYALYPIFIISICFAYEFFHFHSRYDVIAGSGISLIAYVFMCIFGQLIKKKTGYITILIFILFSYYTLFLTGDYETLRKYHIILFTSIISMICILGMAGVFNKNLPTSIIDRLLSFFIAIILFKLLSCSKLLGGMSEISIEFLKGLLLTLIIFVLPDILALRLKAAACYLSKLLNPDQG